jgi:hypothetical protein
MKVKFFDKNVRMQFWIVFSVVSGILSFVLLFNIVPDQYKDCLRAFGFITFGILVLIYILIWLKANRLTNISINIQGSDIYIKCGDLFSEFGLKAIPFNEFFDTTVDDKIISNKSLNGLFINNFFKDKIYELDKFIVDNSDALDILDRNCQRQRGGKSVKFKLSTLFVYDNYIITAFSKFDEYNRANLTMPEYIEFLINFWDRVNRIYAQKSVSVPVFGSGITRIKEHKNISDEDLLELMLWTFKLSEMKFKYPARLTIVIHKDKISQINLFKLKSLKLS